MSGENRALRAGAVVAAAVCAPIGAAAGPGTPLSWAVIVASGPLTAAVVAVLWAVQDRRAARRSSGG